MSKNFVQEFCNLSVGQRKIFLLFMITNWFLALNISSLCCWYDNFPIPPLFLNLRILYLILNLNTRIYKVSNLYLVKFQILTYKWICIFFGFYIVYLRFLIHIHTHLQIHMNLYLFYIVFVLGPHFKYLFWFKLILAWIWICFLFLYS